MDDLADPFADIDSLETAFEDDRVLSFDEAQAQGLFGSEGLGSIASKAKAAAAKAARDPAGAVDDARGAADAVQTAYDTLPRDLNGVRAMIAQFIPEIEVRTAFTPPMIFKTADLLVPRPAPPPGQPDPNPPPPPTTPEGKPIDGTALIKPTVFIRTGGQFRQLAGRTAYSYAPGGVASATEWKRILWIIAGVTAGLVGVGVGTGYLLWGRGRKSK